MALNETTIKQLANALVDGAMASQLSSAEINSALNSEGERIRFFISGLTILENTASEFVSHYAQERRYELLSVLTQEFIAIANRIEFPLRLSEICIERTDRELTLRLAHTLLSPDLTESEVFDSVIPFGLAYSSIQTARLSQFGRHKGEAKRCGLDWPNDVTASAFHCLGIWTFGRNPKDNHEGKLITSTAKSLLELAYSGVSERLQ